MQTGPPVTAQSQQVTSVASSTTDGNGNGVFTFPAPAQGFVQSGTMNCPGAPVGSTFVVNIGATIWGTWTAGPSIFGPIQALANQPVQVTATGLLANTAYELQWIGSLDQANVQPLAPDPSSMSVTGFVTTGDECDLLASGTYTLGGGGGGFMAFASITPTAPMLKAYSALVFAFVPNASPNGTLYCALAQITGGTLPIVAQWSTGFRSQPLFELTEGIIPFANQAGQLLQVNVYGPTSGGTGTYALFGLTSCPVSVRSDARAYPLGAQATSTPTTTSATIVAAITNARFLIRTVSSLITGSAGAWIAVLVTVNGNPNAQVFGAMANAINTEDFPEGLLCDTGTAITVTVAGTPTSGRTTVYYDIVPA